MHLSNILTLSLITMSLLSSCSTRKSSATRVPVMYGDESGELDACTSLAHLEIASELNVLEAPTNHAPTIDKIDSTISFWICDQSKDGKWLGIIYSRSNQECEVSTPVNPRRAYQGSCQSGWISNTGVIIDAG